MLKGNFLAIVDVRRRIRRKLAKRHYSKAAKLFEANEFEGAIREYDAAISADPDYASAYFNRSLAKALKCDYEGARADAERVMQIEPGSHDAPYVMGVIAEHEGKTDEARTWYEKALAIKPDYESAKKQLHLLELPRNKQDTASEFDLVSEGQIRSLAFVKPKFGFESVVGLEHAKEELFTDVVLYVKRPDLFAKYGAKPARGALLCGPPGVGKTTLAMATAKEAGVNLIVAWIQRVVDMYAGNTEKNIHAIFEQARNSMPCIIFLDELDGLGLSRDKSRSNGESPGMALAVNQLLVEMDGVEENPDGLFVIGATNRPSDIDPALKQRFAKEINIDLPRTGDRKRLFERFVSSTPHEDVDYDSLANMTQGYSPREIRQVCDRAATLLVRNEHETGVSGTLTTEILTTILREDRSGWQTPRMSSFDTRHEDLMLYS